MINALPSVDVCPHLECNQWCKSFPTKEPKETATEPHPDLENVDLNWLMPLEIHFSSMLVAKARGSFPLLPPCVIQRISQRCFKLSSNTFHTLGLSTQSDLILLQA